MPPKLPEEWKPYDLLEMLPAGDTVVICNGFLDGDDSPESAKEVEAVREPDPPQRDATASVPPSSIRMCSLRPLMMRSFSSALFLVIGKK